MISVFVDIFDIVDELARLMDLRDRGELPAEEYRRLKARIIAEEDLDAA